MLHLNRPINRIFFSMSLCFMLDISQAKADISCEPLTESPVESILCQNESPNGVSSVLLRNMPPWMGHGGVTIIDICPGEIQRNMAPQPDCERRYCSQNSRELAIVFSPIVVPIHAVAVNFGFTFVHRAFEIRCGAFVNLEEL